MGRLRAAKADRLRSVVALFIASLAEGNPEKTDNARRQITAIILDADIAPTAGIRADADAVLNALEELFDRLDSRQAGGGPESGDSAVAAAYGRFAEAARTMQENHAAASRAT